MKKLLILNGSISEVTLIDKAKELGYYVVTSGNAPSLIGHSHSDEYIMADYSDKDAVLKIVKENNIDAIVSCANDFGVITSSYVAEKMGWPGHDSYETAVMLHQKDLFKDFIQSIGIRTPISKPFSNRESAIEFARTAEYPIIVKATDLTGGKGILRADNIDEAIAAIDNAFNRSRVKHIVIEPFIEGDQQTIHTFIKDKKVISSVSNDAFSPINPYLIQAELFPAKGIEKIQDELVSFIELICERLDLVDGMLTLQYIVKDGKPYVIELMRRALGNQYLTVAGVMNGFPWEEALIRAETGMDLSCLKTEPAKARYAGHHGIMATRNGVIKGYTIPPEIEKHIFKKIEMVEPGGSIDDYMNERIAYIYYAYDNYDEALDAVLNMNSRIKIEYGE
ncbi:MAG: acetyl-CoA carboxylase biotin carboxylase subunit family protein [Eubacterium sp.]